MPGCAMLIVVQVGDTHLTDRCAFEEQVLVSHCAVPSRLGLIDCGRRFQQSLVVVGRPSDFAGIVDRDEGWEKFIFATIDCETID